MKVCLTIAGLDPSGGAGVIADIKTFVAFGCFPTAAITALTFQNTTGVFGAEHQTAETLRGQVKPIMDDFDIAAVKTGMLPTKEIIEETARLIMQGGLHNVVVDPVVRSTSGFDLIDNRALGALVEKLFPLSNLVTPNIPEAERITGLPISDQEDIEKAARLMQEMGAKNVLIKGGHFTGGKSRKATDYLFEGTKLTAFEAELIETEATHGTGCALAAAIAANLALGKSIAEAVGIAKEFVHNAIRTAHGLGRGHPPINISFLP